MAMRSIQSGIKRNTKDFSEYGLFLTGIDVSAKNIDQFDPFRGGFARIFILRVPYFMKLLDSDITRRFKHFFEMGFTKIDGIGDATLETEKISGGYTGGEFAVPSITKDQIDEVTVSLYEFSGSPIREFIDTWMTGISDPLTGLSHYHGAMADNNIAFKAKNHTMECVYVLTDPTGFNIEYSCLLSNMMPTIVPKSHLNYESGSHPAVTMDLKFTANKYESPQINGIAQALLDKFKIVQDYLDFNSGYSKTQINNMSSYDYSNRKWVDVSNEDRNQTNKGYTSRSQTVRSAYYNPDITTHSKSRPAITADSALPQSS